ncbi:hypothetical protein, partial [Enterococcus faecalis]|uniref:hypothetical protein n=1 Tax=Enterococcus faecalis TaxID=1351 RepID=UPI001F228997
PQTGPTAGTKNREENAELLGEQVFHLTNNTYKKDKAVFPAIRRKEKGGGEKDTGGERKEGGKKGKGGKGGLHQV